MVICNEMPEELIASYMFDEKQVRPHLKSCLLDGRMRHFPCKKRSIKSKTRKVVEMFCTCRQLEYSYRNMISCDECGELYHQSCTSVNSNLWDNITQVLIYFVPVENVAIEYYHDCNLIVTCIIAHH